MIGVDGVYPSGVMVRVSRSDFSRWFRDINGISQRVPDMWVLNFMKYFNCCSFILNIPNLRSASGDNQQQRQRLSLPH